MRPISSRQQWFPGFRMRSAVIPIIGVNILFFILQQTIPGFTDAFILVGSDIFTRPWILLTHMFLHANLNHIFFNMYGILLFGPLLESRIGPKRLLEVYLVSGLVAGFFASFAYARALGASAALMGLIGALIIIMPQLRLLFFFIIPMPLWLAGLVWVSIDVFGVFFPSGVGNIAHLFGMGTGILFGLYFLRQRKGQQETFAQTTHLDDAAVDDYLRSGRF
ncbi:MAG: rhomboid family intramembrane serine protease [DPANN group archaeon]|nr:rhomboid family intramembrane serine protease [DPANN group archaeon]